VLGLDRHSLRWTRNRLEMDVHHLRCVTLVVVAPVTAASASTHVLYLTEIIVCVSDGNIYTSPQFTSLRQCAMTILGPMSPSGLKFGTPSLLNKPATVKILC
jgi:hypothetical protein